MISHADCVYCCPPGTSACAALQVAFECIFLFTNPSLPTFNYNISAMGVFTFNKEGKHQAAEHQGQEPVASMWL